MANVELLCNLLNPPATLQVIQSGLFCDRSNPHSPAPFQVIVMLICLYVLPKSMPRYAITSNSDYYLNDCVSNTVNKLGIPVGNGTYNGGNPGAQWYCNVMNFCGFPMNSQFANTPACVLFSGTPISSNQVDSVCFNNATSLGQGCSVNNNLNTANDNLSTKYLVQVEHDWTAVLSLLFNAFIMCQVRNW